MIGLAFGGGILLSTIIGGRTRSRMPRLSSDQESTGPGTWDVLQGALVGMAATKLKGLVEELLPGFQDEYRKVAAGKNAF
jgi:hypothetical protein